VDLGAGLRAETVYGVVRVVGGQDAPGPAPAPVALAVPGRVAFGHGEVRAEAAGDGPAREGTLDADAAGTALTVRARRPGDRMRPLGCGGSRSLQDLLVDRRVPRAARAALPVVEARGRIAWIPGVATGEDFAVTSATTRRVQLAWDPPGRTYP
jgi:tRNA(Ile)-lysidine synthase